MGETNWPIAGITTGTRMRSACDYQEAYPRNQASAMPFNL